VGQGGTKRERQGEGHWNRSEPAYPTILKRSDLVTEKTGGVKHHQGRKEGVRELLLLNLIGGKACDLGGLEEAEFRSSI